MTHFKLLFLMLSFILAKACYPVSHVIVGETQPPIFALDAKLVPPDL